MNVSARWFMIMLTWFSPVPPEAGATPVQQSYIELRRQEIPRRDEQHCEGTVARLTKGWINAPDTFGHALDCQRNPNWKPKGERK